MGSLNQGVSLFSPLLVAQVNPSPPSVTIVPKASLEDIGPGRRSGGAGLQTDDIVSAIGSKTTPAIVELQIGRPRQRGGGMYRCRAIDGGERRPRVAWLLLAGGFEG